ARMQEMKEKEVNYVGNGDANSHVCKVCFESPTAAMLLPCRHFSSIAVLLWTEYFLMKDHSPAGYLWSLHSDSHSLIVQSVCKLLLKRYSPVGLSIAYSPFFCLIVLFLHNKDVDKVNISLALLDASDAL
ncbi:kinesin-like protein KIN-7D, mitochondrial, partial [Tanacetum coccineum]